MNFKSQCNGYRNDFTNGEARLKRKTPVLGFEMVLVHSNEKFPGNWRTEKMATLGLRAENFT